MSGLQEVFYIMGIVFMSLMFLLMLGIFVAVLVIRSKINKIHHEIESKINSLASFAERGGELSAIAKSAIFKQIRKAFFKV